MASVLRWRGLRFRKCELQYSPFSASERQIRYVRFIVDLLAHFLAVVGLVRGDGERCFGSVQHIFDDLTVMDVSARQNEVQWPAFAIDNGVDFCGPAATADADRLIILAPFAPFAARWAFTIVLSIR